MNITHQQTLVSICTANFYSTIDNIDKSPEALEQVTANLANFAYDPINWPYLHEAEALELFVTALDTQNPNLQLHAVAALCNFCLGNDIFRQSAKFLSIYFRNSQTKSPPNS